MIDLMAVPFDGIIIIIIFSLLCYCIIEKKITQNKELDDDEYYLVTNLKCALEVFERQNKL